MKILLTGNKGFIGSHLQEALKQCGHMVFGFDFKGSPDENLCNAGNILSFVNTIRPDMVIHHAASVSVPESIVNPSEHWENNVLGTANLLEAMRIVGVKKIIFASSSSVYGNQARPDISEDASVVADQLSPYAASKIICEKLIETYHTAYGINYLNLRYFNVFGERGRGVITAWMKQVEKGLPCVQYGNPERDYTHVSNVVFANLCAIEADESAWNWVYNIGCGVRTSLDELAAMMGIETIKEPAKACDVEISSANIYRAKKCLGYDVLAYLDKDQL